MSYDDSDVGVDTPEAEDSSSADSPSRGVTRRRVLQGAAAAGGALVLPGFLSGNARAAADAVFAKPKRGGNLRVGQTGSGTSETLNPLILPTGLEVLRSSNLYDKLFVFDILLDPQPNLAESMTARKGSQVWQLKLKKGVHFHSGKELTAKDVIYTWKYILDPSTKSEGMTALEPLDMSRTKAVGKYEIEIHLKRPIGALPDLFASRHLSIIPSGFSNFERPNGTGPFKFQSWTPGQQSVFVRNPNYHGGAPYVDTLTVIVMNDDTAKVNALLGGQVDAINTPPISALNTLKNASNVKLLGAKGPGAPSLYMRMDVAPFTDVRVRQAMRYAVDRQMIKDQFALGIASIANDLYGRGFPSYARNIAQRQHDPDRAKSLLKAAGQDGLTLTLPMRGPTDALAITFAQAVKDAGITIKLQPTPAGGYWDPNGVYLSPKASFYITGWPVSFEDQAVSALLPNSPFIGETEWNYPGWAAAFRKAQGITDAKKRNQAYWDLQKPLHEQGGYIVPIFRDQIDAYSSRIKGVHRNPLFPLGYYNFKTWWFS